MTITFAAAEVSGDGEVLIDSAGDDATAAVFHTADAADSVCANAGVYPLRVSAVATIAAAENGRRGRLLNAPALFMLHHAALSLEFFQV